MKRDDENEVGSGLAKKAEGEEEGRSEGGQLNGHDGNEIVGEAVKSSDCPPKSFNDTYLPTYEDMMTYGESVASSTGTILMKPPLSPLIDESPHSKILLKANDIPIGSVDYVIKCTRSDIFLGRFLYCNRTAAGEVFGSDPNRQEVTMYIERAGLSAMHARIVFNETRNDYILYDLGSETGTWVQLRSTRSATISSGQMIQFGRLDFGTAQSQILVSSCKEMERGSPQELIEWLGIYQLQQFEAQVLDMADACGGDLRNETKSAVEELRRLKSSLIEKIDAGLAHQENELATFRFIFKGALEEIDEMFPVGAYDPNGLVLSCVSEGASGEVVLGWAGGSVLLVSPTDEIDPDPSAGLACENSGRVPKSAPGANQIVQLTLAQGSGTELVKARFFLPDLAYAECIRVGYSYGKYYCYLNSNSIDGSKVHCVPCLTPGPVQGGWVRLDPKDPNGYMLHPSSVFRIGSLEFKVHRYLAGVASMQGFRPSMEDAEVVDQDLAVSNLRHCSLFGVYDGHGGTMCVDVVRMELHAKWMQRLNSYEMMLDTASNVCQHVGNSIIQGCRDVDAAFIDMVSEVAKECSYNSPVNAGCAAVVAMILGGVVFVANVGDCRAVLCRRGKAIELSCDHRPERADEEQRVIGAGGFVSYGRVQGRLAVSRAFGDVEYKRGVQGSDLVICDPEVRMEMLEKGDEFILLACDGLFDVYTSQEAVDFVRGGFSVMPQLEQDPDTAVTALLESAIYEKHSRDNVTAILIMLRRNVDVVSVENNPIMSSGAASVATVLARKNPLEPTWGDESQSPQAPAPMLTTEGGVEVQLAD